jgi:hypothetical protein
MNRIIRYTEGLMKTENPRKVTVENKENKKERSRIKKFPEIDPDEKKETENLTPQLKALDLLKKTKEKKTQKLTDPQGVVPGTVPTIINDSPVILEAKQLTLKGLSEIASPVVSNIKMQKDRGITKTNFIVQTKRFGEVEIDLIIYDTAPHSFHLKLYGTKEIQELSMRHQNILQTSIKEAIPRINILIAPPALRKRDRFPTKPKKSIEKTPSSLYGEVSKGKLS